MKILRIKLDDSAKPNKGGYLTAYENDNKSKANEPDFKGNGVAVWLNTAESVETVERAAQAGAVDPRVVKTLQG